LVAQLILYEAKLKLHILMLSSEVPLYIERRILAPKEDNCNKIVVINAKLTAR